MGYLYSTWEQSSLCDYCGERYTHMEFYAGEYRKFCDEHYRTMIKNRVKIIGEDKRVRYEKMDTLSPKHMGTNSSEYCPKCETELEHLTVKGEDVFGCPKCKKEIPRKKAILR